MVFHWYSTVFPLWWSAKEITHEDAIKWKHFPRYWPFVRGIHRSPVNSPHKGLWRRALMSLWSASWINGWVNNHEAGDLRRQCPHYDVIVMKSSSTFSAANISGNVLWLLQLHDTIQMKLDYTWINYDHDNTVETLYNTVNFCWSTHKGHSIARPKGRGMGCLLWVQRATYCVDLSKLSFIKYLL